MFIASISDLSRTSQRTRNNFRSLTIVLYEKWNLEPSFASSSKTVKVTTPGNHDKKNASEELLVLVPITFVPVSSHKKKTKTKKTKKKRCVSLQYVMSMSSKIQNFKTVYKKYWGLSREEIVKKNRFARPLFLNEQTICLS